MKTTHLVAAGVAVLLAGLTGCGGGGTPQGGDLPTVEVVVRAGFTGPFWVVLDPAAPDLPSDGGVYRVTVPAGGVLRARSLGPLEGQHRLVARYDDGSPLGSEADPAAVALRGGAADVSQRGKREYRYVVFYVGTDDQAVPFLVGDTTPKGVK